MGNITNKKTFSELAWALANDYDTIYVINSDDDSYVEYSSEGTDKELYAVSSGDNFYSDTVENCRKLVWPEDQSLFLRTFKKENVIKALNDGKSFVLRYRLSINNKPEYFSLKSIRMYGGDIIIGVQNIDEVVRRQMKDNEKNAIYIEIAKSLGSMFEVIYYIDINTGHYTEYYSSKSFSELGLNSEGSDFFDNLQTDIEKHIYFEDREMLIQELNKINLLNTLKTSHSYSLVYRQILEGRMQYVSLFAFMQEEDDEHIVIAVRNIDAQVKKQEDLTAESLIFNELAIALAQRYEVIYYVNVDSNEYIEYTSSDDYARLEEGARGSDFFADTYRNMQDEICPEDLLMMQAVMNKDKLLRNLEENGKLFVGYRLMIDGSPNYMALFAVRPKMDSEHIIIAVANVDYAKKKELEFEKNIGSSSNILNQDVLTGLNNKRLFAQTEMNLDNAIESGADIAFSVVVCDINGLKSINETQGKSAGDKHIIEASDLLKDVFVNSVIYRVGGDEFGAKTRKSKLNLNN